MHGQSHRAPLTLVVPNHNGARFLADTLNSLAASKPDVRWHLRDARSTDASLAIANRFASADDVIVSEPDRGQADALNKGFAACGGDILGWLNSDDVLLPGAARTVLAAFARHPEADIVFGGVEWIDADGRPLGTHHGAIHSLRDILDIHNVWWRGSQWVQPEVFFRRSLWERAGGIDSTYDLAFDFDLWVRMLEAGANTLSLPETLARFRLHDAQKSNRAREAAAEIRRSLDHALRRHPPIPRADARRIARLLAYDRHQSGERPRGRTLAAALLRHPDWLLIPEVRRRLRAAFLARLPGSSA